MNEGSISSKLQDIMKGFRKAHTDEERTFKEEGGYKDGQKFIGKYFDEKGETLKQRAGTGKEQFKGASPDASWEMVQSWVKELCYPDYVVDEKEYANILIVSTEPATFSHEYFQDAMYECVNTVTPDGKPAVFKEETTVEIKEWLNGYRPLDEGVPREHDVPPFLIHMRDSIKDAGDLPTFRNDANKRYVKAYALVARLLSDPDEAKLEDVKRNPDEALEDFDDLRNCVPYLNKLGYMNLNKRAGFKGAADPRELKGYFSNPEIMKLTKQAIRAFDPKYIVLCGKKVQERFTQLKDDGWFGDALGKAKLIEVPHACLRRYKQTISEITRQLKEYSQS